MALVRVYCGLAQADLTPPAGPASGWLTAAVVDDSGRLVEICDIADDAAGYAQLSDVLQLRAGGIGNVMFGTDSDEHMVADLLVAAGRPIAYIDEDSADDFADRFGDDESAEEVNAAAAERRAVGLGRALQAGALSALSQPASRELANLKPVLAAHAAVSTGRSAAATTLREVLRELNPAALRAYPDPAEPLPLAILEALPEPGLLGPASRGRDQAVAGELVAAGYDPALVGEAITALRVAINETPRRAGITKALTAATAHTVRQAVEAVRANDSAAEALIQLLSERLSANDTARAQPASRGTSRGRSAGVTPLRSVPDMPPARPSTRRPKTTVPPLQPVAAGPSAAASGVIAAMAGPSAYPQNGGYPAYPSPPVEIPTQRTALDDDFPTGPMDWPVNAGDSEIARAAAAATYAGSTYGSPTQPDPSYVPQEYVPAPPATGRVTPPWQAMDLPPEPPQLRLVERDGFSGGTYELVPPRPVAELPYETLARPSSLDVDSRELGAPVEDTELLIFAEIESAWFIGGGTPDTALKWENPADEGWLAAQQAAEPKVGESTMAGLPSRVPAANLIPGSPAGDQDQPARPLRIFRDPAKIAAHASGYFGGWRRGQQNRPTSREANNWDFSREADYAYRSAGGR